ncbi:MAG: hypothetical protein K2X36_03385 [Microbacteriaceae bacterium]|nr:hypothetical protein [Microbacteriaceae bacterium]
MMQVTTILAREDEIEALNRGYKKSKKSKKSKKRKAAEMAILEYNLLHIPRVLKHDLRRLYTVMFSNVYNTTDYSFMSEFLQTFFRPDVRLLLEKRGKQLSFLVFPSLSLSLSLSLSYNTQRGEVSSVKFFVDISKSVRSGSSE